MMTKQSTDVCGKCSGINCQTPWRLIPSDLNAIDLGQYDRTSICDWARHRCITHMVFRAIKNRVSMIKADVGFDSTIVDPYGRILNKFVTPTGGVMAVLVADVPFYDRETLVMRWGDWVGWIALIGLALFHTADLALVFIKPAK